MIVNTESKKSGSAMLPNKQAEELMSLICFSHLRWDFAYQRPQHLISRKVDSYRVFFVEEPLFGVGATTLMDIAITSEGINRVVPILPEEARHNMEMRNEEMRSLVEELLEQFNIQHYALWYYTPMMVPFTSHLKPSLVVYDCMDELSAFKYAPEEMKFFEEALLRAADVVLTGGHTLYQAKRGHHNNIHPFPSSIDKVPVGVSGWSTWPGNAKP